MLILPLRSSEHIRAIKIGLECALSWARLGTHFFSKPENYSCKYISLLSKMDFGSLFLAT